MKNIKSKYIFEFIFSHIKEKTHLSLIKYNKSLQKKSEITLTTYKKFIGKYIIYGENGKGKIYNSETDKLIFEGTIINRIHPGKGKEYDYYGGVIFMGEYLDGKRKRGKEYYPNGNIKFEGEYLNGKKWKGNGYNTGNDTGNAIVYKLIDGKGYIREYNDENQIIFEGEYVNGEKTGKGKEYEYSFKSLTSYVKYEAQYINGVKNGKGKEYNEYHNATLFEGEYLNGKRMGKGKEFYENHNYTKYYNSLKFEGEYLNGERNGKGVEYYENCELKFEGEFLNGKYWNGILHDYYTNNVYNIIKGNGIIIENYDSGNLKFKGEYKDGERKSGKEYYDSKDNLKFEGEYLNGKKWNGNGYDINNEKVYNLMNGKGYVYFKDYPKSFKGQYSNGERNGIWKEYHLNSLLFEGEYKNGKRNGKGKEYNWHLNQIIFEGEYLNGERNGKGKEYFHIDIIHSYKTGDFYGKITHEFEGEFIDGKRNGKGKEYTKDKKLKFDGYYINNYRSKGKYYIKGKLEYEGEFLFRKKWNGKGYDEKGKIIYELKEGNGKVKEYNEDDILIYEGEYLNGEKNGKSKEYHEKTGKLIFRGEYKKGIRHGKAKEYDKNGKLLFNGEYINGKKIPKKY